MPTFDTGTSSSSGTSPILAAQARLQAAQDAEKKKGGGGILGGLKRIGGSLLSAIDLPRAALVSGANELGDLARYATGKDETNQASFGDFLSQTKRHMGAGEVVEQSGLLGDNKWAKRAVGGVLDLGADPLNAVTFGSGEVSKVGLAKVGQVVGDDVAREALRTGGTQGLRDVLAHVSQDSLEDVLSRGTGELGKTTSEEAVQKTLTDLDKNAKGGLGIGGHRTGLGQSSADRLFQGARASELGQAVRPLFNPVSRVSDKFGEGAASAVDNALHSATQARRTASVEGAKDIIGALDEEGIKALKGTPRGERLQFLRDAADGVANKDLAEGATAKTGVWDSHVQQKVASAITDDLMDSAPELISNVPKEGWADLGNGFHVPQAVQEVMQGAVSASPSELVKAIDVATNALKRYTTLGPLNAIPHVSRNVFSNMLFAGMYGGVKSPKIWEEVRVARKALRSIIEGGEEVSAETLARHGVEGQAAARALALHEEGLAGRGGHLFDDVANQVDDVGETIDGAGKKGPGKVRTKLQKISGTEGTPGTRTASRVNEWHEELSRGAVFLQGLDDGLSPQMAAQKSRKAMLDYSQEGLTPFERDKLARLVFFYKFPRRAVPAGIKFSIEHPGAVNVANKLGVGVAQGKRNSYGEKIGQYFDTPLESTFGTLQEIAKSPGTFAAETLHPVVQAIGDKDKRGLKDLIPPISQLESRLEGQESDNPLFANPFDTTGTSKGKIIGPGGGLLGPSILPGGRVGVDYDAKDNNEAKDKFALKAEGKPQTKQTDKERLTLMADKLGVENAYTMSEKDLLTALGKAGVKKDTLLALLRA